MARLVFKPFRVSSVNATAEVANVQNGETFVDTSTGQVYYKDNSTGEIKAGALEGSPSFAKLSGAIAYNTDISGRLAEDLNATKVDLNATNSNFTNPEIRNLLSYVQYAIDLAGNSANSNVKLKNNSPLSTGSGNIGDLTFDTTYLYVCIAANTWRRIALGTAY